MVGSVPDDDKNKTGKTIAECVREKLEALAHREPPLEDEPTIEGETQNGHKIFLRPIARSILREMDVRKKPVPAPPLDRAISKISAIKENLQNAKDDIDAAIIHMETAGDTWLEPLRSLRDTVENLTIDLDTSKKELENIQDLKNPSQPKKKPKPLHPSGRLRFAIYEERELPIALHGTIVALNTLHADLNEMTTRWNKILDQEYDRLKPTDPIPYQHGITNLHHGMNKLERIFSVLDREIHGLYLRVLEEQVKQEMAMGQAR